MMDRYNLDNRQVEGLMRKGPLSLSTVRTISHIFGCTEEEVVKKVSEIELEPDNS